MEWYEFKNGYFQATVSVETSVNEAMVELCKKIHDIVIPYNTGVNWNYIRIEIWADSGRFIAFPASTSCKDRIDKAGCQIVFSGLLLQYEQLADSDANDDVFQSELAEVVNRWIDNCITAAKSTGLVGYCVRFYDTDLDIPLCEIK